jgi:hypothetical protein
MRLRLRVESVNVRGESGDGSRRRWLRNDETMVDGEVTDDDDSGLPIDDRVELTEPRDTQDSILTM